MLKRINVPLLHRTRTHHTNTTYPGSKYVYGTKFPEQYTSFLGTIHEFKFRNQYRLDIDEEDMDEVTKLDEHHIYSKDFYIIRADKEEPYKVVCISTDFNYILGYDNSNSDIVFNEDEGTIECDFITSYPLQLTEFVGLSVFDRYYNADVEEILAVTLRVDNGEPCYTILAEFIKGGEIRIVFGDECLSRPFDYYPFLDLNGKDPNFNPTDPKTYIDVDGYYPAFYSNYNGDYRDHFVNTALVYDELLYRYMHQYADIIEHVKGVVSWEYDEEGRLVVYNQDTKYKYDIMDPNIIQLLLEMSIDDTEIRTRLLELELELKRLLSEEEIGYPLPFIDINGGNADIFKNMYTRRLKDSDISKMRRKIFEENKLYGLGEHIISDEERDNS